MVGGMANTAGGVLIAYVGMLSGRMPDIAGHLITSSVLSAPAAILICKIMMPETGHPVTAGDLKLKTEKVDSNAIEAATRGAAEGLELALNVAAMLVAFIALAGMVNWMLGHFGTWIAFEKWAGHALTLEWALGKICSPLAWLVGVPWSDAQQVGSLLGQKVVFNEFVAYAKLTEFSDQLSDRTLIIVSYALCGFANISSIGIQVGGIGVMAPSRRKDLAALGVRAVIAGNLASLSTAAIAGMLY
jgi:concentrative nucleoside transporter, CNT family